MKGGRVLKTPILENPLFSNLYFLTSNITNYSYLISMNYFCLRVPVCLKQLTIPEYSQTPIYHLMFNY